MVATAGGAPTPTAAADAALAPCAVPGVEHASCGTMPVFEDRERKAGRQIALRVMVLPALAASPAPDPFVVLVGGPGEAATADAAATARRFAAIRATRDILLVDQRGTGGSNPLRCGLESSELARAFFTGEVAAGSLRRCRERLASTADVRFYTTAAAMDDLDDVRAWLGYDKLNLYGLSYGTRAAQVYLRRHPERVRTMTLRSVLPATEAKPLRESRDAQTVLDVLFGDCARDAACAQAFPSVRAEFDAVLRQLQETPARLTVPDLSTGAAVDVVVTSDFFAGAVRRLLYDADLQALVPLVVHRAAASDFTPLRRLIGQSFALERFVAVGMNASVTCAEDVPFVAAGDIPAATVGTFLGTTKANALFEECRAWNVPAVSRADKQPVASDVPALLLSGAIDPDTPPDRAADVARTLSNARRITLPATSHSPLPPCAVEVITRFVERGAADPSDDAACSVLRRPAFLLDLPVR